MFSGIVETTSRVVEVKSAPGQRVYTIRTPRGWNLREGESVSVEGVCSTVQRADRRAFMIISMAETLRKTTLGNIKQSAWVNLERSLTLQSLIGGHLVQGHVDATARIKSIRADGDAKIFTFQIEPHFSRYIAPKGSIAVDGISLTVVDSAPGLFTASLLAYTLQRTTLRHKRTGSRVNIEVDLVAKYVERLLPK